MIEACRICRCIEVGLWVVGNFGQEAVDVEDGEFYLGPPAMDQQIERHAVVKDSVDSACVLHHLLTVFSFIIGRLVQPERRVPGATDPARGVQRGQLEGCLVQ